MQLHYNKQYAGTSPTVRKNGDIINSVWKVKDQNLQVYSFEYDYLNRIKSSDYEEPSNGSADDRYNASYSCDMEGRFYPDRSNIISALSGQVRNVASSNQYKEMKISKNIIRVHIEGDNVKRINGSTLMSFLKQSDNHAHFKYTFHKDAAQELQDLVKRLTEEGVK